MPINPTTLKALIDTQITNETVNFAITPAEVGGRIKDAIDYTTEQITGGGVTPDATISVKGKIQLAGDLAGTANSPTVPSLVNKEDLSNKSTNVTTDGLSDTKYPSVKAVKDYVDANSGSTVLTEGIVEGNTSFPYNQTTFDITTTSPSLFNSRLVLPAQTPEIGKIYIVRNIGVVPIIIRTRQISGGGFYFDGTASTIEEFSLRANVTAYFTYVGGGTFIVNLSQNETQEYNAYLFQSGTNNISEQFPFFNTLTRELDVDKYLRITYERLGVGDYEVRITFEGLVYNTNAFSVSFNDPSCRIYSITNSSLGGGASRKTFAFKTYTPSGVLSDDQLVGGNGSQITIKYNK